MQTLESEPERAHNRLQSAARIFYIMAVVKVLELLGALRPPMPSHAAPGPREAFLTGLFAFYAISVVLCIVIGRGLEARRHWARIAALIFSALHVLALVPYFITGFLGPMAIIGAVLGVIGFFSVLIASALGAFEEAGPDEGSA